MDSNAPAMTNGGGLGGFFGTVQRLAGIAAPFIPARSDATNGGGQDNQGQEAAQVVQQQEAQSNKTLLFIGLGLLAGILLFMFARKR